MGWMYNCGWLGGVAGAALSKSDSGSPCLVKSASGLTLKKDTAVRMINGVFIASGDTNVTMPAVLTDGSDYAVYVCADGTVRADISFIAPSGYTTENSRMVGGFHYSAIPANTTLASGQFATSGQDVIWNQQMLDNIKGINKYSIWDLGWKPACSDPRGMAYVPELRIWVDIYLTNTTSELLGTSRHNSTAASGAALPLKPLARGGNGVNTYPRLGWWEAAEIAATAGKRLLTEREFNNAAVGVTENSSLETANNPLTTNFEPRYTSIYGLHQMTGCHWIWGEDHGTRDVGAAASAWDWRDVTATPARGKIFIETAYSDVRVLLGGNRTYGGSSGSRAAAWNHYPWVSAWNIGLRAASDHLQLA